MRSHLDPLLTGRYRHRRGFFGRLILQVEVSYLDLDRDSPPAGRDVYWRDACVTDMVELHELVYAGVRRRDVLPVRHKEIGPCATS